MPYVGMTNRGLTSRDGLWLAAAVVLHSGLLLLPISPEPANEPPSDRPLLIELNFEQTVEQPFVQQDTAPGTDPVPPPEPIEPEFPRPQPEPPPEMLTEIAAQVDGEATGEAGLSTDLIPTRSTAVLLQSAADRDWPLAKEDTPRKLGVFLPRKVPENWRRGITHENNMFNGMTVPRKVEIVDRWLSSDGSHNVVINTPTGDTFCGRGLAWDPMQPLVEHVMQFRPCGGGGKRTFEMPDRYRKNSLFEVIANSTTN